MAVDAAIRISRRVVCCSVGMIFATCTDADDSRCYRPGAKRKPQVNTRPVFSLKPERAVPPKL